MKKNRYREGLKSVHVYVPEELARKMKVLVVAKDTTITELITKFLEEITEKEKDLIRRD